jgi:hypothetical protein
MWPRIETQTGKRQGRSWSPVSQAPHQLVIDALNELQHHPFSLQDAFQVILVLAVRDICAVRDVSCYIGVGQSRQLSNTLV